MLRNLIPQDDPEEFLDESGRTFRSLMNDLQRQEEEFDRLFRDYNLDPAVISEWAEKEEFFPKEVWQALQAMKIKWNNHRPAPLIDRNPRQKTFAERAQVAPHWLFLR